MKGRIVEILKELEKSHKIRIVFAIENGSRAWGMESKDSDYDVRFVFARNIMDYITISPKPDVIEYETPDRMIDVVGFDVLKFGKLFSSSNPQSVEWSTSPIVYYGKVPDEFREFATKYHKNISLYHHYKSMCRQNYLKYLKSHEMVTYKKYLYAMRGLVNAKYVEQTGKLPPFDFSECITKTRLPLVIKKRLLTVIEQKKRGFEKEIKENIVELDEFIERFLKEEAKGFVENKVKSDLIEKAIRRIVINRNT